LGDTSTSQDFCDFMMAATACILYEIGSVGGCDSRRGTRHQERLNGILVATADRVGQIRCCARCATLTCSLSTFVLTCCRGDTASRTSGGDLFAAIPKFRPRLRTMAVVGIAGRVCQYPI